MCTESERECACGLLNLFVCSAHCTSGVFSCCTPTEKARKKRESFKAKRKAHYREWEHIQEAKRLMVLEEEEEDDDEDE
jgi:Protein phosphatase inhibitor 2 (IPP-2)